MRFQVDVTTAQATGYFIVEAGTVTEGFSKIPMEAADRGLGLINDGPAVIFEVRILP